MFTPDVEIFLIAVTVTGFSTLVTRLLGNPDAMRELGKEMKKLQEEFKTAHKNRDEAKMKKLQEKQALMMGQMMKAYGQMLKPMAITFIPLILVFKGILEPNYSQLGTVATLPILNWDLNWFWFYLVCAVVSGMVLDKVYRIVLNKNK